MELTDQIVSIKWSVRRPMLPLRKNYGLLEMRCFGSKSLENVG